MIVTACPDGTEIYSCIAQSVQLQPRKGEDFQIPVQPIIDSVTYERYLRVRESKKTHPIRNIKCDYLSEQQAFL
jgi:hypothetical protein